MPLTLGSRPERLTVLLTPGSDFLLTLRPSAASGSTWKPGVRLELVIGTRVWVANAVDNAATFAIDQDEVDAALAQEDLAARLYYVEPNVPAQTGSVDESGTEIRLIMAKGQAVSNG